MYYEQEKSLIEIARALGLGRRTGREQADPQAERPACATNSAAKRQLALARMYRQSPRAAGGRRGTYLGLRARVRRTGWAGTGARRGAARPARALFRSLCGPAALRGFGRRRRRRPGGRWPRWPWRGRSAGCAGAGAAGGPTAAAATGARSAWSEVRHFRAGHPGPLEDGGGARVRGSRGALAGAGPHRDSTASTAARHHIRRAARHARRVTGTRGALGASCATAADDGQRSGSWGVAGRDDPPIAPRDLGMLVRRGHLPAEAVFGRKRLELADQVVPSSAGAARGRSPSPSGSGDRATWADRAAAVLARSGSVVVIFTTSSVSVSAWNGGWPVIASYRITPNE